MAVLEDPVEDVFVTNVETPEGNRRIFEGTWESNDYFLQVVLDTLMGSKAPEECRSLLRPAFALLRLSDCVAARLDMHRWHIEPSTAKGFVPATAATRVNTRASLDFRRKKGPNNSPPEITKPSRLPIACRAHKPQPICAPLQFW